MLISYLYLPFFPVTETTQACLSVNMEEFVKVGILRNIEMHQYKNFNTDNVIIVHVTANNE